MNKILTAALFLSAATAFVSCAGEEDDIFNNTAAERLNATSQKYSARLEAQPNGWAMQYYPSYQNQYPQGSGYLLLMDFDPNFMVRVAMDNAFSNNTYAVDSSAWEVISDNGPVLSFNSFNKCMHAFSDPEDIPWTDDADPNRGSRNTLDETGEGCGGDYEFIVVDAPEDASYMMLKGKKRGTYNLLTPVEVGVDYKEYLADVKAFQNKMFSPSSPTGDLLVFGDSVYVMEDANEGLPSIYPIGTDKIVNQIFNPFLITKRGEDYYLRFRDTFGKGANQVQEFKWMPSEDIFRGVDNPQAYIRSDSIGRFFESNMFTIGKRWEWNETAETSESYKAQWNSLADELKAAGTATNAINLTTMCLRVNSNILTYRIQYRIGRNTNNLDYNFEMQRNGDLITFKFLADFDDVAAGSRAMFPEIQKCIELLEQEWILSRAETAFNLSRIRLTSSNDNDMWFIVTIY